MAEKTFDLRGLKCPLPVLRTRKALAGMRAGDILVVACTDPLSSSTFQPCSLKPATFWKQSTVRREP